MENNLRRQIYNQLNSRSTDELVEIWVTNDRVEWSDTAFDVIAEILSQRLGELPPQNPAILVHVEQKSERKYYYEDYPSELLEQSEAPIFYEPKEVLWMNYWLKRFAIAWVVVIIIFSLNGLQDLQRTILSFFSGNVEYEALSWFIGIILGVIIIALQCAFYYFLLRGLAMVLKILMNIEYNSRAAIRGENKDWRETLVSTDG